MRRVFPQSELVFPLLIQIVFHKLGCCQAFAQKAEMIGDVLEQKNQKETVFFFLSSQASIFIRSVLKKELYILFLPLNIVFCSVRKSDL